MSDDNRPLETEIKLRIPADSRALLERHPAFQSPAASPAKDRDELTTYFDTSDLALNRSGISLRIRHAGGRRVQTVKTIGDGQGLAARRGQWESRVAGDVPDLRKAAATPAGAVLTRDGAATPLPICTTRIDRATWQLRRPDGTRAEAALDRGVILAGDKSEAVSELELELKEGEIGSLYRLALDLTSTVPLAIEPASKADRGFRLHTGEPPPAREATDIIIDAKLSAAEAFASIVGAIVGHMLANMDAVDPARPEAVHQLRTAVRRMRTALVLFGRCLHAETARRFADELRRIGQVFGEARDWDVFASEVLPAAQADVAASGWIDLLGKVAEEKRAAAYRAVRHELLGSAFTRLVLGVAGWVEQGRHSPALLGTEAMARTIGALRSGLLDRMARTVARRGKGLGKDASGDDLHALRKAAKKLRFSAEFLAGPEPGRLERAYIGACKNLAKRLGDFNDARMTPVLAARLGEGQTPEVASAIGLLEGWSRRRGHKASRRLPKAWRRFRSADEFW